MYEIDKSKPIPDMRRGRQSLYPFKTMEIGDSFGVPKEEYDKINHATYYQRSHYGRNYIVRKVEDGYRVWRTA